MMIVARRSRRILPRCCWNGGARAASRPCLVRSSSFSDTAAPIRNNKEEAQQRPVAVVLGVANQRSIAWACVQEFLRHGYDCVFTYQDARHASKMEQLIQMSTRTASSAEQGGRILGCLPCNVQERGALPVTLGERLPELLLDGNDAKVEAVVHSLAYCANLQSHSLLHTTVEDYLQAQHVSAYSFLETARALLQSPGLLSENASLTALSYVGAVRAVPGYGAMGPAKAALEALVRGLAWELGQHATSDGTTASLRCNAVSAGPLRTAAARGIPDFGVMQRQAADAAPLRRNVSIEEVARTVVWLGGPAASGVTGQTVYVDAGYSAVVPIGGGSSSSSTSR